MRIGIFTFWDSLDNYGQQLQCFALQTMLRNWGHDAFLIRYAPKERPLSLWQRVVAHVLHPKYFLLHIPINTAWKKALRYEQQLQKLNLLNNPQRRFEQFRQDYLQMTDQIYESYAELRESPPQADVYIAGSDQIWRPPIDSDTAPGWFLQFGNKETKRISYAASMGEGISSKELPVLKKYLALFDAISVREEPANILCRQLGYNSQVCIDPMMLLEVECYRELAKRPKSDTPYAFVYVLNIRTAEEFFWPQIKQYLEEEKLHIKSVSSSGYYQGRELIENNKNLLATIPEWLGYIDEAKCVFTTSYHGTVCSILMHRPFLTIGIKGKYSKSNARMEQLLMDLGIPERMFNPNQTVREQMEATIDWEDIDQRRAKMRLSSIEFLKDNLMQR